MQRSARQPAYQFMQLVQITLHDHVVHKAHRCRSNEYVGSSSCTSHSLCRGMCGLRSYHNLCVSRGSVSHTECIVRECHVDRAGCSAYSIAMRTVCDVAYSLRGNSCNFAEWLIATCAARAFYSVRADPLSQHISRVSLALMTSARNSMGLSSPRRWGNLRASRILRSWHRLRSS